MGLVEKLLPVLAQVLLLQERRDAQRATLPSFDDAGGVTVVTVTVTSSFDDVGAACSTLTHT